MKFKKGDTHYVFLAGIKPYKIHIMAIIDDCMVVYKYYGRHQQWWHYKVVHVSSLRVMVERARNLLPS